MEQHLWLAQTQGFGLRYEDVWWAPSRPPRRLHRPQLGRAVPSLRSPLRRLRRLGEAVS
jgi:hypothetical protein